MRNKIEWPNLALASSLILALLAVPSCMDPSEGKTASGFRFTDVSDELGVTREMSEHGTYGTLWADLNGDNWLDLIFVNHGNLPSLYANQQGSHFIDVFDDSGISTEPTYPEQGDRHGAACADYDNDGDIDLIFAHGAKKGETLGIKYDELLRNKGSLTFEEVSHETGVLNSQGRGRTPTWVDFDNDGWLDLYIGNALTPNVLYKNTGDGDGKLIDLATRVGLSTHKGVRQAWADYNQDGWLDVLIVRPVQLYRNNGNGTFTDATREAELKPYYPGEAMAIAWGDYNNDGNTDLFITTKRTGENALYRNNGDSTFTQVEGEFGPYADENGMGAKWGDIDNDGDLDLLVAGTKKLRTFENIEGHLQSRDLDMSIEPGRRGDPAFGDYDNDGYLDLALATDKRQYLFRNELPHGNNWLKISFDGRVSNRQGFGAKVWVQTDQGQRIFREYQGDMGTLYTTGCGPLHIGVGNADSVSLSIEWPSGITQTLKGVKTNQLLEIREPES